MSTKVLIKPVDILGNWYMALTQINQPEVSKNDKLVFERNGSVRLNYDNQLVKEQINKHIETFSKIDIKNRG